MVARPKVTTQPISANPAAEAIAAVARQRTAHCHPGQSYRQHRTEVAAATCHSRISEGTAKPRI